MSDASRLEGLRREYEAGRINANAYISAGGDPDNVERVETRKASRPVSGSTAALKIVLAALGAVLGLYGIGQALEPAGPGGIPPILWIVAGLLLVVLAVRIKDRK